MITLSSKNKISRKDLRDIVAELKVKHANLKFKEEKFRSWFSTMLKSEFHFHRPCSVFNAVDDGAASGSVLNAEEVELDDAEEIVKAGLVEPIEDVEIGSSGGILWKGRLRERRDVTYPK